MTRLLRYRWFLFTMVLCCSCLWGWLFVLKPEFKRLQSFHALIRQTQMAPQPMEKAKVPDVPILPKVFADMENLRLKLHIDDFTVKQISRADEKLRVKISAQSQSDNIIHFLAELNRLTYSVEVIDFKLLPKYNRLHMMLTLHIGHARQSTPTSHDYQNLFCRQVARHPMSAPKKTWLNPQDQFKHISIQRLKLVGIMEFGNRRFGLMQLPDHKLVEVFQGDLIGREQASVQEIADHQLTLQLAHHTPILFHL